MREDKLYKRCTEKWDDFCPRFLKISRAEADRTIRLLEEFGAPYFVLTQLTRVSPETYRAIAPAIQGNALYYRGEAIDLNPQNSRRVAAAVAELRSALPKRAAGQDSLLREIQDLGHELNLTVRIEKLHDCATALVAEFEKIARDPGLGLARMLLNANLTYVRSELGRLAADCGL